MFAIIDLEWTSWKNSIQRNWSFCWEKKEIIQIGAIKFNNKNYVKKKNLIVRPKINQNLSYYVQKLTGISQFKINTTSTTFEKAIFELNIFYNNIDKIYCNETMPLVATVTIKSTIRLRRHFATSSNDRVLNLFF